MNLDALVQDREQAVQFMVDDITHVCRDFGKREPGSRGEEQACEYFAELCRNYGCENAAVETFQEHPYSFFGWMWITFSLVLISVVLFFFAPVISVLLISIGWAIAVLQFGMYCKTVDFLFPEKTGHNMTASRKPSGEVLQRVYFNGHCDAVWEWPVNYKYGGVAFELHMIISAVGAAFYLILSVIAAAVSGPFGLIAAHHWYFVAALIGLLFVPFFVGMFFMWDRNSIVDGANDNLSGCYMGLTILRELKEKGIDLEHTEVGVIICGSEEAGLRGSKAWAEQHQGEYDDIPTYIYSYDTIHDPKWLMANYRDLNGTVKTDKELNDLFMKCAEELGIPCRKGWVPPLGGATDAAAFTQGGFRSGDITGLNHKLEDYYHTRRDTCDNMNPQGLADCYAISVKVLEKIENGAMDGR